jgi:16S rRNA (cytidine1402-2'-O)-methyltransferase
MGKLILVPTPIDDQNLLDTKAKETILRACENPQNIFCVEEEREGRRRWLRFGLPREKVQDLLCYNEHTAENLNSDLIKKLKAGSDVYLMSDAGLPAFCDPGQELVNLCHENKIAVDATPFSNSLLLAIMLSGFKAEPFYFQGFLPKEDAPRLQTLKELLSKKHLVAMMETPYRYKKLLSELMSLNCSRLVFIGIDLNMESQLLYRGPLKSAPAEIKAPFILLLAN